MGPDLSSHVKQSIYWGGNTWSEGMQDTGNQAIEDCGPYHTKNKGNTANYPSLLPWENFQDLVQRATKQSLALSLRRNRAENTQRSECLEFSGERTKEDRERCIERQLHRTSKDLLKKSTERRKRDGYTNAP